MTELLTAAQMRAIERAAIDSGAVTGLELMERAGRGVIEAIFEQWPRLKEGAHRAVVLCGPGNNGGDAFVVARRLRDQGWSVEVLLYGDPSKLPPDALTNYEVWSGIGEVSPLTVEAAATGARPALVIDAMFGTGLSRAIPLECANAFHAVTKREVDDSHPHSLPCRTVAVDCASGLDCDSGKFLFPEPPVGAEEDRDAHWNWWQNDASRRLLHPDLTVTFHRRKVGHHLGENLFRLRVVDIGLGREDRHPAHLKQDRSASVVTLLDFDEPSGRSGRIWPGFDLDKARLNSHKYSHGHALILSGGPGKGGAARLAARGALRIGAGLVTLGCPPEALAENAAHLDAIMLRSVRSGAVDGLDVHLEDERINALCLGPGLGVDSAGALVTVALRSGRACLLDADALTWLAGDTSSRFKLLHDKVVLTPHAGEFARLFPDIVEKLNAPATKGPAYSKVDATREAAKSAGCVVLFKGPDTVIADPSGRCSINSAHYDRAAPWLATAGSGDVLAGFITGLLTRGFPQMAAAETGAWLHVECARKFGPGLIAEDLPEQLPSVFGDLGL